MPRAIKEPDADIFYATIQASREEPAYHFFTVLN